MCRSRLLSKCQVVRAPGLSVPTDTFRTTYPGLNIEHCDSLRSLQLSQDVLDILPPEVNLDPYGSGLHTGLDTVRLAEINNSLSVSGWQVQRLQGGKCFPGFQLHSGCLQIKLRLS